MNLLTLLSDAARAKGSPLSQQEIDAVNKAAEREVLRQRFLNVIHLAGYPDGTKILAEYFDEYMAGDRREFIAMLEEYEAKYARKELI